jgi:DNA-binding NarL/FixJ family response regulator
MMVGPIKASVQGMPFKTKIHTASSLGELKIDLEPALIVADLNLPDSQGLKTLTWLRGQYPQAQILVFSQIDDPAIQAQVLALGACGYVSKSQPPKVFVERQNQ